MFWYVTQWLGGSRLQGGEISRRKTNQEAFGEHTNKENNPYHKELTFS